MMTNTFKPIVGGLERSVEAFAAEYRKRGHRTVVVAPEFENAPAQEEDVIRVPAIQNFNGSDFSVQLPVPGVLRSALGDFRPDIVHSHHPFLIGDTALRIAFRRHVPLVFTYHTLYEHNTHYVPGDSEALKRFVIKLSAGYASLADHVFAPSESVAKLLVERGVETPIDVMPTGIPMWKFSTGDGAAFRKKRGIPEEVFLAGTVGRLAPEKNLLFLGKSVAAFLKAERRAHFLIAGDGPLKEEILALFEKEGVLGRLHLAGGLGGQELSDAYHAMDVFTFASQSETQGMVLVEAMAAGVPVLAVDACGVRDVVGEGVNGRLLPVEDSAAFSETLLWFASLPQKEINRMKEAARKTAERFSIDRLADQALRIYAVISAKKAARRRIQGSLWAKTRASIKAEWEIFKNLTKATGAVIQ